MSPRFLTAIQFQNAARENGWRLVPCADGRGPCGARKGSYVVMIQENRVGGLSGVWFTYPVPQGWHCDYLGPRHPEKLARALDFLVDPTCRGGIIGNPSGSYERRQRSRGEPDPTLF